MRLMILVAIFGAVLVNAEKSGVYVTKTHTQKIFFSATMYTESWDRYNAFTYQWLTTRNLTKIRLIGPVTIKEDLKTKVARLTSWFIHTPPCGAYSFSTYLGYPSRFFNTNNGVQVYPNKLSSRYYSIVCEARATFYSWGGSWGSQGGF